MASKKQAAPITTLAELAEHLSEEVTPVGDSPVAELPAEVSPPQDSVLPIEEVASEPVVVKTRLEEAQDAVDTALASLGTWRSVLKAIPTSQAGPARAAVETAVETALQDHVKALTFLQTVQQELRPIPAWVGEYRATPSAWYGAAYPWSAFVDALIRHGDYRDAPDLEAVASVVYQSLAREIDSLFESQTAPSGNGLLLLDKYAAASKLLSAAYELERNNPKNEAALRVIDGAAKELDRLDAAVSKAIKRILDNALCERDVRDALELVDLDAIARALDRDRTREAISVIFSRASDGQAAIARIIRSTASAAVKEASSETDQAAKRTRAASVPRKVTAVDPEKATVAARFLRDATQHPSGRAITYAVGDVVSGPIMVQAGGYASWMDFDYALARFSNAALHPTATRPAGYAAQHGWTTVLELAGYTLEGRGG